MNNILAEQNSETSIKLLKAQRIAYDKAKNYQIVDLVSILIAVVPPVLILNNLNYANYLSVIGVFWTGIAISSEIARKEITKLGATIQEQFDVELFKLPWNRVLVMDKIEVNKIIELSREYKKEDLKDWYSKEVDNSIEHLIAVLLHYKTNIIWGSSLRDKYNSFLVFCLLFYYGGSIAISIYKNTGIFDFSVWIAPSLPFLVYCITTIKNQKEIIERYKDISKSINKFIDNYIAKKETPSENLLRQIQDLFFIQRLNPHKIPNWFYSMHRKKTEGVADEAIRLIKALVI